MEIHLGIEKINNIQGVRDSTNRTKIERESHKMVGHVHRIWRDANIEKIDC